MFKGADPVMYITFAWLMAFVIQITTAGSVFPEFLFRKCQTRCH